MKITIAISITLFAAMTAAAQPMNVKPGLWETTSTTLINGIPALSAAPQIPPEVSSRMTPEQRAALEKAMQGRGAGGPRTMTSKSCITREMLDKALTFGDSQNQNCKRTLVSSSGTKQDIHMECSNGEMKTVGEIHLEAVDSSTVKGNVTMSGTGGAAAGRGMNIKMDFNSKYLGPDCGDVGKK